MFTLLIAGTLALIYGAVIAFTALKQMRRQEIATGAAALMGFVGLLIMFSALFIPFRITPAFYVLLAGLVAMHILAIKNERSTHGEITPKHHMMRFIISLVIIGLAFWGKYVLLSIFFYTASNTSSRAFTTGHSLLL